MTQNMFPYGREILRVDGLRKQYDGDSVEPILAIEDVSFSVRDGEFVTIVGPSGCGKTTMLKCIAGLLPSSAGTVTFDGQTVSQVPSGLGFVFQEYGRSLFPWLSVEKNVAFALQSRIVKAATKSQTDRVQESLDVVGLAKFADFFPWQLSGGMQQRVAIARALAYQPSLLIMDEPFGSVDAYTRAELEDLMLAVARRNEMTVLLVTHDIDEAVYLGDRVLVLSSTPARVVQALDVRLPGSPHQVRTRALPEFVNLRARVAGAIFGTDAKSESQNQDSRDGTLADRAIEVPKDSSDERKG